MRLHDALMGAVMALLGLAIVVVAWRLPLMPGQAIGPGLFPGVVGAVLAAAGLAMVVRGLRRADGPWVDLSAWHGKPRALLALAWTILGLVVVILAFREAGFVLLATAYAGGLMVILGARPLPALALALAVAVVVHLAFTRLLYVPLGLGPLQPLFG